ncbi:PCMD domain-containing protein, partial [Parabacteroides distasonis]
MEWLPAPKILAKGFTGNTLDLYETASPKDVSFDFDLSSSLQELKFTVNFEDQVYKALNGDYTLSMMSDADKAKFVDAGITLPVIGQSSPSINITELASNLKADNEQTINNIFSITEVKANNRTISGEYKILTHKPEFSVSVLPGNVWTKEFTAENCSVAEGKGDSITVNSDLTYQYSGDNGRTWTEFNDHTNLRQAFISTPENKTYQVRALYRGELASPTINVELETPIQIPNSSMDEWYIETKKKSGTLSSDKTYYTFHPYNQGETEIWWATNNDKAQGGTLALGIWYEGCFASCVSYTTDAMSDKAALMYVSGCGDGYANTSGTYVGGAMVGSMWIGNFDNKTVNQGHGFSSRPTSLKFYYKYKPYNSDAFKVVVALKNGDEILAEYTYVSPTISSETSYEPVTIPLEYTVNKKATTICVQFLATNISDITESHFAKGTTITYPEVGNWTVHMGSQLLIDDISLIYDK